MQHGWHRLLKAQTGWEILSQHAETEPSLLLTFAASHGGFPANQRVPCNALWSALKKSQTVVTHSLGTIGLAPGLAIEPLICLLNLTLKQEIVQFWNSHPQLLKCI